MKKDERNAIDWTGKCVFNQKRKQSSICYNVRKRTKIDDRLRGCDETLVLVSVSLCTTTLLSGFPENAINSTIRSV
jgi:hypothetical protein